MPARTQKPKPTPKSAAKKGAAAPVAARALAPAAKSKKAAAAAKTKPAAKAKPAAKTKPASKAKPAAKTKPASKAKPALQSASKAKPAPSKKASARAAQPAKARAGAKAKLEAAPQRRTPAAAAAVKPTAKSNVAREALKARAMKKAIARVITPIESGTAVVDAYMRDVDHPFKAEMQAVRSIILGASPKIAERIKWNAPSFYCGEQDLGAFHPRATEYAHLVLLFPNGAGIPAKSTLLEGKQKDRREAKFSSLADIEAKRPALEKLVREWVLLREA